MKIYLSLKSIPELKDLSSVEARKKYFNAYIRSFLNWRGWVALFILFFVVGAGIKLIHGLFPFEIGRESSMRDLAEIILTISAAIVYGQLVAVNVRHFLQKT
jgi:hypothetical protein